MKKIALFLTFLLLFCAIPFSLSACSGQDKITCYDIDLELNDYTLTASQTIDFYNFSNLVFDELKFNLFANAFREGAIYSPVSPQYQVHAYPNGKSYGNITINAVKVQNESVDFSIVGQDENILSVPLGEEVFPNERAKVYIEYTVNLANIIARTGYNSNTINIANFYPILCGIDEHGFYECLYYSVGDPFFSDVACYNVSITLDEKYKVASSGEQVDLTNKNGKNIIKYRLDCSRDFAFVISDKFSVISDTSTDTTINYFYYKDDEPLKNIEFAIKAVDLFTELFGAYPYKTLAVVQTPFVQGGMEYPALTMISDTLTGLNYGEVIVHETAHQWWQSAVGSNEIEYPFLDEGLAEYSVVLFYERFSEYGFTRKELIKASEDTYKVFCSVYNKIFKGVNTIMNRPIKDFTSEYEYVNLVYVKPCIMYDYLRQTIGEKKFFSSLQKYYKNYKFKNATPYDMVGSFEKCGADASGFFESFFSGKAVI